MDRSFLSDENIVQASRNFVCIRLATYEDAAAQLGATPESVRKRYERARDLLSQKLAARDHDERDGLD